jgi:hypothetical protein
VASERTGRVEYWHASTRCQASEKGRRRRIFMVFIVELFLIIEILVGFAR